MFKNTITSIFLVLLSVSCSVVAFTTPSSSGTTASRLAATSLNMAKYDKAAEKWITTTEDERTGGYGPFGTLIRFGPKPVLIRVLNPGDYEQGVLKMMASEKQWDKQEAQGNFDAYLENPNDWAFQKNEEKKGGFVKEYGKMPSTKQLGLNAVWSGVVGYFFYDFIGGIVSGRYPFEPLLKFW